MTCEPRSAAPAISLLDLERRRALFRANRAIVGAERAMVADALQRAETAEARADASERQLAAMLASRSWKITEPLRWLFAALPRLPRHEPAATQSAQASVEQAQLEPGELTRSPQPFAFVIDHDWPRPERDAGSIEVDNLVDGLRALGYAVHFGVIASIKEPFSDGAAQAVQALENRGVECLLFKDLDGFEAYLRQRGEAYRLYALCRVHCGGAQFERVRAHAPNGRIVFNTIDLHYIREERQAEKTGDAALAAVSRTTRQREEFLAAASDATLVVSQADCAKLNAAVPVANVFTLPLARSVKSLPPPFTRREGIGFIGGFAHAPNVDAVRFFLDDVWPLIHEQFLDCRFSIVGADLPGDVLEGLPHGVDYLGHVPDVVPWFDQLCLTVAPIRFGSGMKGKVVSSLAAGVPCVLTQLAGEGIGLTDGVDALFADDATSMAQSIVRLLRDEPLWTRVSAAGTKHIRDFLSPEAWQDALRSALWTIDAADIGSGDSDELPELSSKLAR